MKQQTLDLITFMQEHGHEYPDLTHAAASVLSSKTDSDLDNSIRECFYDFIDAVDRPSMVLRRIEDMKRLRFVVAGVELSDTGAMLLAMLLVHVPSDIEIEPTDIEE